MVLVRHCRLALVVAIAAGTVASAATAQVATIDTIRRLVETGYSLEAWPHCESIDREAVAQADLWCGVAAVDLGRAAEGTLSIERYVLRNPADVRARLELARAYFYAGDDVAARREFEAVRAVDPPPEVRKGIDRYLDALASREAQYKPSVRGWIEGGFGYDTNVNAGVSQADIALPVLGPVTVASAGIEQASAFGWLAGSVQFNRPVAPGFAIYGGLAGNGQFNSDASDFDIAQGAATLGASWQHGRHMFFGSYTHGELLVGGDRYRHTDGASLEWRYVHNEHVTTSVTPQAARIGYSGENAVRDSDFYALALSVRRVWLAPWQPVLNLMAVAGQEDNRNGRDDLGRSVYGASADVTVSPAPQWALNTSIAFQRSWYDANIPLLDLTRRDDNYAFSLGALYFITRELSARVDLQYFHNDSNIPLFEYDRTVVAAKLRYDFK